MTPPNDPRLSTGCAGLDEVLNGGLTANRLYLLEGVPGIGQDHAVAAVPARRPCAAANRRCTSRCPRPSRRSTAVAASHGWDLTGIELFDLAAIEAVVGEIREQTMLHPWEVELGETVRTDHATRWSRCEPTRIVFDSLSELRLLAQDPLRYRRQVLALKTVLRRARRHRDPRRRSHAGRRQERLAAAQPLPRRHHAASARRRTSASRGAGSRCRSCAASTSSRASTISRSGAAASRSSRAWSPRSTVSDFVDEHDPERRRSARSPDGRRPPARHQHADHRPGRCGQDDARDAIRDGVVRSAARRARSTSSTSASAR